MPARTVRVRVFRNKSTCYIPVPFHPKPLFGKVRAPVSVTLNGYTFRSTIAVMNGVTFVPFRRSHREAAGLDGGETLPVTFALDEAKRDVKPPADLARALKAAPPAWERWREMSFTHQREYAESVDEAKKPETRQRRILGAVRMIKARPARKRAKT